MNSFINMNDPTGKINLGSVTLEKQYSKLTEEEKLLVFCKLKGMNHVPCTIDQFIQDDYFLGLITGGGKNIYDYWKEKMREMYPSPVVNKYPWVSLGGAIGIGKSTFSRICALYTHHKLDCMINPWNSLSLMKGKPLSFLFSHLSIEIIQREFLEWFKENKEKSPYFQNLYNDPSIAYVASGNRDKNSLGSDLIFGVNSNCAPYQ